MSAVAPGHTRYTSIDSLRAYAMTLVIAQHCDLLPIGWLGVWIFFVISGFVVTSSILDAKPTTLTTAERLRQFYFRRIARIVPLYACYVALFVVFCLAFGYRLIPTQLLSFATFTYNFYPLHGDTVFPISHLWTISFEMQFYLVVGAALILLRPQHIKLLMLALLVLPAVLRVLYSFKAQAAGITPADIQSWEYHVSFFHFDAFAAGCLLSLYRGSIERQIANSILFLGISSIIAFVGLYAIINHMTRGQAELSAFKEILSGSSFGELREALVYVPVLLLSIGCVGSAIVDKSLIQIFLNWKWVSYVGRCSYSGYVIHLAVIWYLRLGLDTYLGLSDVGERSTIIIVERLGLFAIATALTVALSIPMFEWVEKPLARQTRRLLRF
ncbi:MULTISPECIES: acyltransferase [unclassified Sphingomonas]|uniref:acyltransferase family protein n=1 Tax=unclassified Sphingomonas TaxID=196159 RepID=UPI00226B119D|nr:MULTISPECIES: acyltransferase [unclassified Sphingomonas]